MHPPWSVSYTHLDVYKRQLGAWAGKSWEKIADYMKEYALVGKGILIAVVVIWIYRWLKRKKKTVCEK